MLPFKILGNIMFTFTFIFLATQVYSQDDCGRSPEVVKRFTTGGINEEGAWPWMVAIRMRKTSGTNAPWCSGFLIDKRHVLSAAHCFERRETGLYTARIGKVNPDEANEYNISRITIPEGYERSYYYDDIAILTLSTDVTEPDIVPICLPDAQIVGMDFTNKGMTVAGWGSETPFGPMSRNLQVIRHLPVVSNEDCSRILRDAISSFPRMFPRGLTGGVLCAGGGEINDCGVNSGGPLMISNRNRWFAVGVTSFGVSCGRGLPGGYTRVSNYMDWIRENTTD